MTKFRVAGLDGLTIVVADNDELLQPDPHAFDGSSTTDRTTADPHEKRTEYAPSAAVRVVPW